MSLQTKREKNEFLGCYCYRLTLLCPPFFSRVTATSSSISRSLFVLLPVSSPPSSPSFDVLRKLFAWTIPIWKVTTISSYSEEEMVGKVEHNRGFFIRKRLPGLELPSQQTDKLNNPDRSNRYVRVHKGSWIILSFAVVWNVIFVVDSFRFV